MVLTCIVTLLHLLRRLLSRVVPCIPPFLIMLCRWVLVVFFLGKVQVIEPCGIVILVGRVVSV
jgi:hypothetical protein